MDKLKIGYDINLGLPTDFASKTGCEPITYSDIMALLKDFNNGKLAAIFAPCGVLPYLKEARIISQSLFGPEHKLTLRTNFVTTKDIIINEIVNSSIGRVNQCCTTSFWAPMIFLMNYIPKNTLLDFVNTLSFQDMLFKTAAGNITSSMVWDIIMEENAQAADKVHQLCYKADLPTPIIIAQNDFPENVEQKINQFISQDAQTFFRGYTAPDLQTIKEFQAAMQQAITHFNVPVQQV